MVAMVWILIYEHPRVYRRVPHRVLVTLINLFYTPFLASLSISLYLSQEVMVKERLSRVISFLFDLKYDLRGDNIHKCVVSLVACGVSHSPLPHSFTQPPTFVSVYLLFGFLTFLPFLPFYSPIPFSLLIFIQSSPPKIMRVSSK